MQTKPKKRKTTLPIRSAAPRVSVQPAKSPAAKAPARDVRPIRIVGRNAAGAVVAEEWCDGAKAAQVSTWWRESGMAVEITDTAAAEPASAESAAA